MRNIDLYNVDGTIFIATVPCPTIPEGLQEAVFWQDRLFLSFDDSGTNYREARVFSTL